MSPSLSFLLDLWRTVCQPMTIAEAVARAAPLLASELAIDLILIRALDQQSGTIETIAGSVEPLPEPLRSECPPDHRARLLNWWRQGQLTWQPGGEFVEAWPGLLPFGLSGDVVAVPLTLEEPGVLLLASQPPRRFTAEQSGWLQAVAEPFAVAWANDRRLRELEGLRQAAEADKRSLLSKLGRSDLAESIVGAATGLRRVMEQVERVAGSDVPVLILGETGSGKEVIARAVHVRSRCASGPFLRVNCGAIPGELIDSELFGHERGSYTGAVSGRKGWFERADGGTLFLDECGELPLAAQVRLLRILQDGTFQRVGGEKQLHVKVRVVAATHRNLRSMVAEGRFREDLWYRLAVFPMSLPALRERPEDIAPLAAHFALRAAKRLGTAPLVPSAADVELLQSYAWPGNVRELAAVLERAAILSDGKHLEVAQALGTPSPAPTLPLSAGPAATTGRFPTLDGAMALHIEAALGHCRGQVEGPDGAAALLAINPHTLRARMRKLGIEWGRFRSSRRAA